MDQFWEEFETGEIHFRDKWQFELKSQFLPIPGQKQSDYTQEFFIFIPNALHINEETYSRSDFFKARTNLIRLQTPEFTFEELLDPLCLYSPLVKVENLMASMHQKASLMAMETELKLFANIFRSALRKEAYALSYLLEKVSQEDEIEACAENINHLLGQIEQLQLNFTRLQAAILQRPEGPVLLHVLEYIKDFISISLNSLLTGLLSVVRHKVHPALKECDQKLCDVLLREKKYREDQLKEPEQLDKDAVKNEGILFQSGLLNKFILDALQLKTERQAIDEKFRSLIGSFAAATAMLLYLSLFIWQGAVFVINSLPFVIFTVLIYVVKDRIKEELKSLSFKHVSRWFPDYRTDIYLPREKSAMGAVNESFSFIAEKEVPLAISQLRNQDFHSYLEMIKRQERVINYKKKVIIYENSLPQGLNIIYRFDIHNFLIKASNPYEPYLTLDRETLELTKTMLPKVYHINIILKNRFLTSTLTEKIEYKKFRIIADKEGIKRIESVLK